VNNGTFYPKGLIIHFNFVNDIKLSSPICHLVEEFGVAIPICHPVLLSSLMPVSINVAAHQREFFLTFQSFNSIHPREGLLLLLLIEGLHLFYQICHLKLKNANNIHVPLFKFGLQKIHFFANIN